ncbi:Metallo-dependent phosphatase-like protein, partial [Vararia minispora EC-137]
EDTFRILIATDNHIGYLERDPVRGQDSINTFKEILQLAVKHDVDFILLGGDLFHENRPSRDCLYQVMGLLREYTLGDKPISVELLSSPDEGKPASYNLPGINYEDQNLNVAIPVFSIHGNHDDPQGSGPEGALCALDMLSVAGLVNYIGKLDLSISTSEAPQGPQDGITIRPVLLRKGSSCLGLYGVGNVKDARMHFELRSNRVRMYMPHDRRDWFNIMIIHQNRVKHGPQEFVPEGLFDDSIDLVLWGHEHDCRITPEIVAGKHYRICQPGSSVATSLAEGESLEKYVGLLKVEGKRYTLQHLPLRTVRPFVMDDIVLTEVAEEEGFDVTDQVDIGKYLKLRVNELIEKANKEWDERNERAISEGGEKLDRMLPLVRLKVDTTGVPAMSNPIRFGQEFVGRIANPRDVLVFHRAKQSAGRRVKANEPMKLDEDGEGLHEGEAGRVRMREVVQEYLRAQELQLLRENELADAIQVFVDKDDIHAIQSHVSDYLKSMMEGVHMHGEISEETMDEVFQSVRHEHAKAYKGQQSSKKPGKGKGKARAQDKDDQSDQSIDSMAMDVDQAMSDFEEDEPPPPPKRATASRAKAAAATKRPVARGRKKAVEESDDEDDDEEYDDDEVEAPPPKKRTTKATTATKKAPVKKSATTAKSRAGAGQTTLTFVPTAGRTTRAAAGKSRKKPAEV